MQGIITKICLKNNMLKIYSVEHIVNKNEYSGSAMRWLETQK